MSKQTYRAQWGSITHEISADFAQASCPIEGIACGWQVADARHRPRKAMEMALWELARAEGDNPNDPEVAAMIEASLAAMVEV